jgi:hypothetical protein
MRRHRGPRLAEADILARLLGVDRPSGEAAATTNQIGFRDSRFDVTLPEGFEIFLNYKGTEYRAKASAGRWLRLDTQESFPTLNQLSRATSGNIENAWRNWYFTAKDGRRYLIEKLRNDIPKNVRHLI